MPDASEPGSWGLTGSYTQRQKHNELEFGFDHQWQDVQSRV